MILKRPQQRIFQFISSGKVVNKAEHGSLDWVHICEKASKVITFIDLAGHERYLKTTVFGMTGHAPHFGMLMVIALDLFSFANICCVSAFYIHASLYV